MKRGKGKALPRTGYEGPDGEQMYSSALPSASALDDGGWSTPSPGRFTPQKVPVLIVQEAGWASGPVWTDVENLASHRDSIPAPSSPWRVAVPTELSQLYSQIALSSKNIFLSWRNSPPLGHGHIIIKASCRTQTHHSR